MCLATIRRYVCLTLTILILATSGSLVVKAQPVSGLLKTVVIDAGHGGKDPGTEGKNSKEKNVTLAVALKLGALIRKNHPEVNTFFTRETDEFIELNQRAAIANEKHADLFISIHCNAAPSPVAVGVETFVMGLHTSKSNLEVAQRENSVISYEDDYSTKYEGYDPRSPESFMIFSLMQNVFLDQSLEFASGVQGQFVEGLSRKDRGVKQAGFLVLYKSGMPSVLIELGFLSNPQEEKYLLSEKGQEELAQAIYNAFVEYKKRWDRHAAESIANIPTTSQKKGNNTQEANNPKTPKNNTTQSKRVYRIQIATLSQPIAASHPLHKLYPDLKEKKEGKYYRYYSHEFSDIKSAQQKLSEVKRKYPDAFLVAFEGEKKVSL